MVNRVLLSIRSGNPAVGSARYLLVRSNPGWGRARSVDLADRSWTIILSRIGESSFACMRGFRDSYRFYCRLPILLRSRLLTD